jgi:hypothetical protein
VVCGVVGGVVDYFDGVRGEDCDGEGVLVSVV